MKNKSETNGSLNVTQDMLSGRYFHIIYISFEIKSLTTVAWDLVYEYVCNILIHIYIHNNKFY